MSFSTGILLLLLGVIIGAVVVFLVKRTQEPDQQQIKDAFGNLSKEALDQNIETFMKIAENKFGDLMKSSDAQLDEKKKLIDSTLTEMKKQLEGLNK
ncbi:MAG TPA: hypothetical protein QF602_09720, partial [Candidatus Marinimicrobia bacterium]|nr:hypothetical protein [Candidatus Neomarinimicrobiota bacterium]